jgi:hypothetical protein
VVSYDPVALTVKANIRSLVAKLPRDWRWMLRIPACSLGAAAR